MSTSEASQIRTPGEWLLVPITILTVAAAVAYGFLTVAIFHRPVSTNYLLMWSAAAVLTTALSATVWMHRSRLAASAHHTQLVLADNAHHARLVLDALRAQSDAVHAEGEAITQANQAALAEMWVKVLRVANEMRAKDEARDIQLADLLAKAEAEIARSSGAMVQIAAMLRETTAERNRRDARDQSIADSLRQITVVRSLLAKMTAQLDQTDAATTENATRVDAVERTVKELSDAVITKLDDSIADGPPKTNGRGNIRSIGPAN